MERHVFTPWVLVLTCVVVVVGTAGVASGQRVLVDVGPCWSDPGYPGFGPVDSPASDGNYWNNFSQNPRWNTTPVSLVDTLGNPTGASFMLNSWSGCGDGGQVETVPVSNLYPEVAQSDCRWWDTAPGGNGSQPGYLYLTGLNPELRYDIGLYGYVPSGAMLVDDGLFPEGTTLYTIGDESIELAVMDNTTDVAWFRKIVPDAAASVTVGIASGTPTTCGAVLNVVDFSVRPWMPGDADKNDKVNYIDLGILATYYDLPGTWNEGDFNGDGSVDYQDLGILATYYGLDETGESSSSPVPEPATALLLAAAAVPALIRRRRAANPAGQQA